MRATTTVKTYKKVKKYFTNNPNMEFLPTQLRNELNIDYISIQLILKDLLKSKFIEKQGKKYQLRDWRIRDT